MKGIKNFIIRYKIDKTKKEEPKDTRKGRVDAYMERISKTNPKLRR